jgi:hypothetical protein
MTGQRKTRSRTGKVSQVVQHPALSSIELSIANSVSIPKLADRYNISKDALYRYARTIPAERLAMLRYPREGESPVDLENLRRTESELVLQRVTTKLSDMEMLFRLCIEDDDRRSAISAAREYREFLEIEARMLGELVTGDRHLHVHLTSSPEYLKLRARLVAALTPYPEALAAVMDALAHDGPQVIEHEVSHAAA